MILKTRQFFAPRVAPARLSPLMAAILAFLFTAALAAGAFAIYALVGPNAPDARSTAPGWKPPTLSIVELEPPPPASSDVQTLSRPIFSKTRRPAPKAAVKKTETADSAEIAGAPAGLALGAIVRHAGVSQAFIISSGAPDGEWKKVGDTVEAWTVSAIAAMELTLKSGERAVKLRLFADAPPQPPQPPQNIEPPQPPNPEPGQPPPNPSPTSPQDPAPAPP